MELFFIILVVHYCSCNLIKNQNFQNTSDSIQDWTGNGGELIVTSDDGHLVIEANERVAVATHVQLQGQVKRAFSRVVVTRIAESDVSYSRRHVMDGPGQFVPLKPDRVYGFKVRVRQMNDEKDNSQTYMASIRYTWESGVEEYRDIARQPEIKSTNGWFMIKTAFVTPNENFTKALLSLHGPQPGIIFHAANFSLEEDNEISYWAQVDDKHIKTFRKNNVHFRFLLESGMNPADVTVQIDLQRHLFGFGALADTQRLQKTGSPYQKGFYATFNWATIDGFGWPTKANDNTLQDNDTIPLLHHMKENGLKLHGQSFFHGQPPLWVDGLSHNQLIQTTMNRIYYVDNITKGLIDQWEIFDDSFEDTFYKGRIPEFDIDTEIVKFMHNSIKDLKASLRINEMDVLVTGNHTWAYAIIARKYSSLGLDGISAKSSFINSEPNPWLLKRRLDLLQKSALPVWITDLEVNHPDENIRAILLEKALRIYFGHPDVEGITLKNFFTPVGQSSNSTLFQEVEVDGKINDTMAGQRFLDLTQKEWSTHIIRNLGQDTAFTESCFQGSYYIRIFFNGTLVGVKPFTLNKVDTVFEIHLTQDMAIAKPTDPSTTTPHSSTGQPLSTTTTTTVAPYNLIASALSPASHLDLQCVTRWSKISDPGDDKTEDIGCQGDEILTGCSSSKIKPSSPEPSEWFHDGEFIVDVNGTSICRAYNGFASRKGVYAVARCCSARHLSCQYLRSEPSQPGVGATVETTCPRNHVATGCSGLQRALGVRGVSPTKDLSGCLAVDGEPHYGITSAASCCSAPGLKCVSVMSSSTLVINSLKVTCEEHPATVMTSCHALSSGKIKGVYITDSPVSACRVSSEEPDIEAIAVCCQLDQTITLVG